MVPQTYLCLPDGFSIGLATAPSKFIPYEIRLSMKNQRSRESRESEGSGQLYFLLTCGVLTQPQESGNLLLRPLTLLFVMLDSNQGPLRFRAMGQGASRPLLPKRRCGPWLLCQGNRPELGVGRFRVGFSHSVYCPRDWRKIISCFPNFCSCQLLQ